jgi:hypothetical protein
MSQPSANTTTETFATTDQTVETEVTTTTLTQSEAIAMYFCEDLEEFIQKARVNLSNYLNIPSTISVQVRELLEWLFDDLTHLLRNELIVGIHILLYTPQIDPALNAYPLIYHAHYVIRERERSIDPDEQGTVSHGGRLAPPAGAWINAGFAILVDWNPSSSPNARALAQRSNGYWFDWVPEEARYDATVLLQYRQGDLSTHDVTVTRWEATLPGLQ